LLPKKVCRFLGGADLGRLFPEGFAEDRGDQEGDSAADQGGEELGPAEGGRESREHGGLE